jgi:beta-glucosidase
MVNSKPQIETRAKALLAKMTLEEKIAQTGAVWSFELLDSGRFSSKKAESLIKHGIGQIARPGVGTGLEPEAIAQFNNDVQKFLVENTRLGIPAIIHEECLSGFMAKKATIFPQAIGIASSWEPELALRIATVIRSQMRATGVHQGLGPVVDVARDPRWGRIEETFGEDPYLISRIGTAYVKGLQGNDLTEGVIATLKHFAGYGMPEGGLNWAPANIPPRTLREVFLHPFQTVITEAQAMSVMNAYNEIDGIPCAASKFLLNEVLRHEWEFSGIVVSDYYAIENLYTYHRVASDKAQAAQLALQAGIDIELPKLDCYYTLAELVQKGKIPETLIDLAVLRILKLKLALGLFENPYVAADKVAKVFDLPEHRQLALEAARKSIILLKNDSSLLPLRKDLNTIAVIGPNADSTRNILGDYTYPAHAPLVQMTLHSSDTPSDPEKLLERAAPHIVTILAGIKAKVSPATRVLYAKGCEISQSIENGFDEAISTARVADVAIVVAGGKSGLTPDCTCGEMRDSALLTLPPIQEKLVKAVFDTGVPVVLILVSGRPLVLGWMKEKIPAVIMAWLPGEEGGSAIADVLFGDYNPGGKLPVTLPKAPGQIPIYYAHKPSGARSQLWGDYVDMSTKPDFEFGYGLSYTNFKLTNLQIEPTKVYQNDKVKIKVDITNIGDREGEEVVQLYLNDVIASITRPVKELKGFKRIALKPSQTKTVEFELPVTSLAFHKNDEKPLVEPGFFKVMVGHSSADIALQGEFEVVA